MLQTRSKRSKKARFLFGKWVRMSLFVRLLRGVFYFGQRQLKNGVHTMHWWKKGHFGGVLCDFRWVPGDFSLEKNVIFPKICFKTYLFEKKLWPETKNFDFWALYGPQRKKYTKMVIFGIFTVKSHFWVMGGVSRPKKKKFKIFSFPWIPEQKDQTFRR